MWVASAKDRSALQFLLVQNSRPCDMFSASNAAVGHVCSVNLLDVHEITRSSSSISTTAAKFR